MKFKPASRTSSRNARFSAVFVRRLVPRPIRVSSRSPSATVLDGGGTIPLLATHDPPPANQAPTRDAVLAPLQSARAGAGGVGALVGGARDDRSAKRKAEAGAARARSGGRVDRMAHQRARPTRVIRAECRGGRAGPTPGARTMASGEGGTCAHR